MKYLSCNIVSNVENDGKTSNIIYSLPVGYFLPPNSQNPSQIYFDTYAYTTQGNLQFYLGFTENASDISENFYSFMQLMANSMIDMGNSGGDIIK